MHIKWVITCTDSKLFGLLKTVWRLTKNSDVSLTVINDIYASKKVLMESLRSTTLQDQPKGWQWKYVNVYFLKQKYWIGQLATHQMTDVGNLVRSNIWIASSS
jgi:hypothetical protein